MRNSGDPMNIAKWKSDKLIVVNKQSNKALIISGGGECGAKGYDIEKVIQQE